MTPSDATSRKGAKGYATATVLQLDGGSISTLLIVPVQLHEVPYAITCLDPNTRARKHVTLNFQGETWNITLEFCFCEMSEGSLFQITFQFFLANISVGPFKIDSEGSL